MELTEYTTVSHWIDEIIDDIGNNNTITKEQAADIVKDLTALDKNIKELCKRLYGDVWYGVKDEKPDPRRRVLCVNHTSADVKEFLSTNIDDIDMYEIWAYVDKLIPNNF